MALRGAKNVDKNNRTYNWAYKSMLYTMMVAKKGPHASKLMEAAGYDDSDFTIKVLLDSKVGDVFYTYDYEAEVDAHRF